MKHLQKERKEYYLQALTPFAFALRREFTTKKIAASSGLSESLRLMLKKIIKGNLLEDSDYLQLRELIDTVYNTYSNFFKDEKSIKQYSKLYKAFIDFDKQKNKIPCVKFGNATLYDIKTIDWEENESNLGLPHCILFEERQEELEPCFLEQAKAMYEGWLLTERELLEKQKELIPSINCHTLESTINTISGYLDHTMILESKDIKAISDLIRSFYLSLIDFIDDFLERSSKAEPALEYLYSNLSTIIKASSEKIIGFVESLPMYDLHSNFVSYLSDRPSIKPNSNAFFGNGSLSSNSREDSNRKLLR